MSTFTTHSDSRPLSIVFVCTGNICRSAMADVIMADAIAKNHLEGQVSVRSCGLGGWHVGDQADARARAELGRAGYNGEGHRASQLDQSFAHADLFVAMDDSHVRGLKNFGIENARIRLLRSFDPQSPAGAPVEDPYYGPQEGFVQVRQQIEAALPGLMEWAREALER